MTITTLQALLLALLVFYLKATFSPNLTFYWQKPLICSLFVGLIMGDMRSALSAGIAIQLVYIGTMGIGSVVPADTCIATVFGCALAVCLSPTMGMEAAVSSGLSIAVAVGAPATAATPIINTIDTIFNERSKEAALKGNLRAQRLWQWVPNTIFQFVLWVPIVFICLKAMGNPLFLDTLTNVLTPISTHLKVVANVLPAVGIALALRTITSSATVPYIIIGFVLTSYLGMPIMGTTVVAVCIAALMGMAELKKQKAVDDIDDIEDI